MHLLHVMIIRPQVKYGAAHHAIAGQFGETQLRLGIIGTWRGGGLDLGGDQGTTTFEHQVDFQAIVAAPPIEGVGAQSAVPPGTPAEPVWSCPLGAGQ